MTDPPSVSVHIWSKTRACCCVLSLVRRPEPASTARLAASDVTLLGVLHVISEPFPCGDASRCWERNATFWPETWVRRNSYVRDGSTVVVRQTTLYDNVATTGSIVFVVAGSNLRTYQVR